MALWSTMWSDVESYNQRARVLDYRVLGWKGMAREIMKLGSTDVLIVNGALGYPDRWRDLVLAGAARTLGRRFGLVVSDATWEPRSLPHESSAGRAYKLNEHFGRLLLRRLVGPRTVVCFLSQHERDQFVQETGCAPESATFTPFTISIDADRARRTNRSDRRYVWTGGNTLRDWDLLKDSLDKVDAPVRVVTSHTSGPWPDNFQVGPLPHDEFVDTAARASVGVITLRNDVDRSAGQQTYLNLLALGVPVVVNDAPGVRDHLEGAPGAYVTPADADAVAQRVSWLLDPDNAEHVRKETEAGRRYVQRHFGLEKYLTNLLEIGEDLARRL